MYHCVEFVPIVTTLMRTGNAQMYHNNVKNMIKIMGTVYHVTQALLYNKDNVFLKYHEKHVKNIKTMIKQNVKNVRQNTYFLKLIINVLTIVLAVFNARIYRHYSVWNVQIIMCWIKMVDFVSKLSIFRMVLIIIMAIIMVRVVKLTITSRMHLLILYVWK